MTLVAIDPRPEPEPLHSEEAEHAVLGAILFSNDELESLPDGFRADWFAQPYHVRIFGLIVDTVKRGRLAEPIGLAGDLANDPAFKLHGGVRYLADLVDQAPAPKMAGHFGRIVADFAMKRSLVALGQEIVETARTSGEAVPSQISEAEQALAELAHVGSSPSNWATASNVVADALAKARTAKGMSGLSTGLTELDDAIGGLRKGQMILIGGRPAMGKSTAALQIAKAVSRKGRGVVFYSMEMPHFDLGLRMACDVTHDPLATQYAGKSVNPRYFDAARGRLSDEQWWKLDQAREDIEAWPLLIDDRPGLTVSAMQSAARRQFRKWERAGVEPGCVIIDHLTIAKADEAYKGNKVAEVTAISRGVAEMAKTLDVPVVALCQLSRAVESRGVSDKRPTLADLRWSGDLEADARVVAFLYRPEYYLRKPEDEDNFEAVTAHRAELDKVRNKLFWLIEKNNNGPTGQVETYCDIACSAIRDRLGAHG